MQFTRRALLGSVAASLVLPRLAGAGSAVGKRKFVFVFCPGGWDPAMVFAPVFNDVVDRFPADRAAQVGDIAFVDADTRPAVRTFLETWSDRTAFVNGILVPSVAHDVATHWAMCGESRASRDDWASIIAGHADEGLLLPNLHVSGPIFPRAYAGASVRVGSTGQLAALLSGDALDSSTTAVASLPAEVAELQRDVLARRLDRWAAGRSDPSGMLVGTQEERARERAAGLAAHLETFSADGSQLAPALDMAAGCLVGGLSRTAVVGFGVGGNGDWDTHANNDFQDPMFEELFAGLDGLVRQLDDAPGDNGGSLFDETVIVVLSEMGRTPGKNAAEGKDHWTWTSAMLIGSGIRGGRTVGGWTDDLTGEPTDLASGEVADSGVTLLPGHLGATLLALADIDPGAFLAPEEGSVIEGLLG